jgi:hypothetical protein
MWYILVIIALERLWQKDHEFEASLGYIVRKWEGKGREGTGKGGKGRQREKGRERGKKENFQRILSIRIKIKE